MKRLAWVLLVVLFVAVGIADAARDRDDRWVRLGEKTVKLSGDRDEIRVGASEGRFKRLKILVRESDVEFEEVKVVFAIGRDFDVPMRSVIRAGGETLPIDLPGDARTIRKIVFRYKTAPGTLKRAKVSVWGLKD